MPEQSHASKQAEAQTINSRAEQRFACDRTIVQVLVGEEERPVEGEVLDVSGNGLRVRVRSTIAVGCRVRIDLQNHPLSAEVRFCRPDECGSFQVGLRILEFDAIQSRERESVYC